MSAAIHGQESFVVFPLGSRLFALPTTDVIELSRDGQLQAFPHTTPVLGGILVRRGEILPVWDLASRLRIEMGPSKFWLVTRRNFAAEEPTAVAVSGECQMLRSEMLPPPEGSADYVRGILSVFEQPIEVLDLARLTTPPIAARPSEKARRIEEE